LDFFAAVKEPLQNSLRFALARARVVHGVAFLADSQAIGCKKRLVVYPDPHPRILARVLQSFLKPRRFAGLASWGGGRPVRSARQ
jgi:hypothetical protein